MIRPLKLLDKPPFLPPFLPVHTQALSRRCPFKPVSRHNLPPSSPSMHTPGTGKTVYVQAGLELLDKASYQNIQTNLPPPPPLHPYPRHWQDRVRAGRPGAA